MKHIFVVLVIALIAVSQAGAWTFGNLRVRNESILEGPLFLFSPFDQTYAGTLSDAFTVNYTGSGNNIFNFEADGVSVMSLTKAGVLTLAGSLSFDDLTVNDEINWEGGNITYVPLTGDIQAYVTAATAGDTLVLASGTYNITSTITIDKRLTLRGQGRAGSSIIPLTPVHGTTISCSTAAVTGFAVTSDDVLISDLSINMTGAGSTGISVAMDSIRVVFADIYVFINSTGLNTAYNIYSSDVILRDMTFYVISTDSSAAGVYFYNDSSSTINATLDAFTVTGTAVGNTGYAYAFACYNINDANTLTLNLTNCLATASGGTVADWAVISTSVTTNNASVYAYNCILDGADADAVQAGTNVLDVGGSTLLNETTSGTITHAGLIMIDSIISSDPIYTPVADFYPQGDGSANGVVCTGEADGTNRRLFNRTEGISDTQDMDWYTEFAVDKTPTSLTLWTRASDFANCVMNMQVWDFSGNADATGAVAITPTGNDTWEEFTYTFTSTYTKDEELWVKISITSLDTADTVDFGRIKVNY